MDCKLNRHCVWGIVHSNRKRKGKTMTALAMMGCLLMAADAGKPLFDSALIFDPAQESHGHVHASCVVLCPNGDLLAAWYENGPRLPEPHFSGEQDKSDDVRIAGSRKTAGSSHWEKPFIMADTFGVSDNNPCMVVDRDGRLWLFHATLLGVPKVAWGSALIQFHVSSDYMKAGPPQWERSSILAPHPLPVSSDTAPADGKTRTEKRPGLLQNWFADPYKSRLGWMPRAHPIILHDGAILLPLANENAMAAAMAFSRDGGLSWNLSQLVPTLGLEQPTVVEYPDGAMTAFFRNEHLKRRILRSDSTDGGQTWSAAVLTELPHPGSGIEAIVLKNGNLAMIYNDSTKNRDSLAISLSEDRGASWRWTRRLENEPGQRFDYPSIVQSADETLHVTYSLNTQTIKYVHLDEAWIRRGN